MPQYTDTFSDAILAYCEAHTTPDSEVLAALSRHTHANVMQPRMLSGHLQGRVLALLSQLLRPKFVLEVGTYVGYSAICLAEGLVPGGQVHTLDVNDELEHIMRKYWAEANMQDKITFHLGDAHDLIPKLNQKYTWDLVFIDADKPSYINYYNLVVDAVRPGGIIVSDNVLWSGKVADPTAYPKDTALPGMLAYNKALHEDPRTENVLLPIRDGLMVSRKL